MADRNGARSGLLLWILCLATAVAVPSGLEGWRGSARGAQASEPRGLQAPDTRIDQLIGRVEALEGRLRRVQTSGHEVRAPEPAVRVDPLAEDALAALSERLERVEGRMRATRQQVPPFMEEGHALPAPDSLVSHEAARDAAHAVILDPQETDSRKAHAWRDLSHLEIYPWNDDVVAPMTHIGASSTDDRAREVVWIGADTHHTHGRLAGPLIDALSDPVANVREEAADALGHYLGSPGVRQALAWAAENDPDAKVRAEALRSLGN